MNRHYREPLKGRKWTTEEDHEWDRKHGVKEGSRRDQELDRERSVPVKPRKEHGPA